MRPPPKTMGGCSSVPLAFSVFFKEKINSLAFFLNYGAWRTDRHICTGNHLAIKIFLIDSQGSAINSSKNHFLLTVASIWPGNMFGYLFAEVISFEKRIIFREPWLEETLNFLVTRLVLKLGISLGYFPIKF